MKKGTLLILILAVIIVILLVVLILVPKKNSSSVTVDKNGNKVTTKVITPIPAADIEIMSPLINAPIASPLKINGLVRGGGWSGFEGQVGTVQLLDPAGDELAKGVLTATTDWTKLPTDFQTTLTFKSPGRVLGKLVFHNENPGGDKTKDKMFFLPVTFK